MAPIKFLSLRVRTAFTVHGYNPDGTEIVESAEEQPFAEKLVAIERILSISEKYLLVSGIQGRVMYWEYEGGLEPLRTLLLQAGLLLA